VCKISSSYEQVDSFQFVSLLQYVVFQSLNKDCRDLVTV
jgi:hypothetical protein